MLASDPPQPFQEALDGRDETHVPHHRLHDHGRDRVDMLAEAGGHRVEVVKGDDEGESRQGFRNAG